jgi:hypothetical protein
MGSAVTAPSTQAAPAPENQSHLTDRFAAMASTAGPSVPTPDRKVSLAERMSVLDGSQPTQLSSAPPPRTMITERFAPVAGDAPWSPDAPDLNNPGATEALNVIPTRNGFKPVQAFANDSDALSARPLGAAAMTNDSGVVYVMAGDATKLYSLIGGTTWDDVSGATYTTPTDGNWEFTIYDNTILATNYADAVQSINAGVDTAFSDHITGTNKPKAKHIDVIRDFVVLGNTDDTTDGTKPNRVWWSGIGSANITNFDPSQSTQSDFNDVADIGQVQRVVGGVEYGLVFFERGIERMTYTGTPEIFRFDRIDRKRGTPIPNSIIAHGRRVFFISEEGFMVTHGTGESEHIGHWAVDKQFWDQYVSSFKSRISAAVDPINKTVMWSFRGDGHTANDPSDIYIYSWADNRWSHVQVDHRLLLRTITQGTTLEGLDTLEGTNIDTDVEFSLDSEAYKGGLSKIAGFDTSDRFGFFDGANLAATIDTVEVQCTPGRFSRITNSWPIVDGGAPTVAIDSRIRAMNSKTAGSDISMETNGSCPQNVSSRYHTAQFKMPAGQTWSHAQGVELEYIPEGTFG